MTYKYGISELRSLIAWQYFYYAWGVANAGSAEQKPLRADAEAMLDRWEGHCFTHAVIRSLPANSVGDDIVTAELTLPMLRQQSPDYLCLADYVKPRAMGEGSIGVFAVTVDATMEELSDADPYVKMLSQVLADRLAEATAEKVSEVMPGIRPAVGYPSIPDMSINFLLDRLVDFASIGVRLTESGMMMPHASVSGLIFPNPKARYFSVGTVGDDQLADYARRRGFTLDEMRKYIKDTQKQ